MCHLKIFFVSLLASLAAAAVQHSTRIIGGSIIPIDQAPYIVSLQDSFGHFCGGTLVSPRYVVTAAHCFEEVETKFIQVVAGISTLSEVGVRRKIEKLFVAEDYNDVTNHMDVAVIKLDGDMKGQYIQPIPLCSSTLKRGDMVQVSGWGITRPGAYQPSQELRTVRVPVLAKEDCVQQYKKGYRTITDSMLCASDAGTKDSCTMDSGGPLVFKSQLCGIVSWGIGCAQAAYPGVYTDVNKVMDFIKKSMED